MGVTLASFHEDGKTPVKRILPKIIFRGIDNSLPHSLIILTDNLSGPCDLFSSRLDKMSFISALDTSKLLNLALVLYSKVGSIEVFSKGEHWETK